MPLQTGDKVTVYRDPITQEHPEGVAELLEKVSEPFESKEYWNVRFEGDRQSVNRWIAIFDDGEIPG